MSKWFNYAGTTIVKTCKWITGISATVSGVYGIVDKFYDIPGASWIVPLGACISAVAMFIVGKAKPDQEIPRG